MGLDLTKTKYQWMYTPHDDYEALHFVEAVPDWNDKYWEIYESQFDQDSNDNEANGDDKYADVMPWTSACGLNVFYSAPGMFSRMGLFRCNACCDAIGISHGKGSAINDDTCQIV